MGTRALVTVALVSSFPAQRDYSQLSAPHSWYTQLSYPSACNLVRVTSSSCIPNGKLQGRLVVPLEIWTHHVILMLLPVHQIMDVGTFLELLGESLLHIFGHYDLILWTDAASARTRWMCTSRIGVRFAVHCRRWGEKETVFRSAIWSLLIFYRPYRRCDFSKGLRRRYMESWHVHINDVALLLPELQWITLRRIFRKIVR